MLNILAVLIGVDVADVVGVDAVGVDVDTLDGGVRAAEAIELELILPSTFK